MQKKKKFLVDFTCLMIWGGDDGGWCIDCSVFVWVSVSLCVWFWTESPHRKATHNPLKIPCIPILWKRPNCLPVWVPRPFELSLHQDTVLSDVTAVPRTLLTFSLGKRVCALLKGRETEGIDLSQAKELLQSISTSSEYDMSPSTPVPFFALRLVLWAVLCSVLWCDIIHYSIQKQICFTSHAVSTVVLTWARSFVDL